MDVFKTSALEYAIDGEDPREVGAWVGLSYIHVCMRRLARPFIVDDGRYFACVCAPPLIVTPP